MNRLMQAASNCLAAAVAVGYALVGTSAAWAQAQPTAGGSGSGAPSGGAYVLPYALVILCVFLAVFLVFKPTKRRDKPKT
jgi:hypothetical protein